MLDFLEKPSEDFGEEYPAAELPGPEDDGAESDGELPPADGETDEEHESGKKRAWPRALGGMAVCAVLAGCAFAWYLDAGKEEQPAGLPQGDILASLSVPAKQENSAEKIPAQPQAAAQSKAQSPAPVQAQSPASGAPAGQAAQPSARAGADAGGFGKNPFIDLSLLHAAGSAGNGVELPYIDGSGRRALPDIPRPSVSPELLPSPGEIRTPDAPAQKAATVGGIITGADGSAIAIMGDGTVLSEGDTYKGDRRVTFIGGEGISFDNGDSIAFGQKQ